VARNQKLITLALFMAAALSLTGCGTGAPAEKEPPLEVPTIQPETPPIETIEQEPVFFADVPTDLEGLTVHELVAWEDIKADEAVEILITVEGETELVSIYEVAYEVDEDAEVRFFLESESLLDVKDFDETQAILLTTIFPGILPNLAVVYIDSQGASKNLIIGQSGNNGNFFLTAMK